MNFAPSQLRDILNDRHAGCIANDNTPLPDRYSDDEGMSEWFASIRRTMLVSAYLVAVAAGVCASFWLGWRG